MSAAIAHSGPLFEPEPEPEPEAELEAETEAEQETETASAATAEAPIESTVVPATDPTVANAGMTEIDAGTDTALTNGHLEEAPNNTTHIANADVADEAANAAGESQWDTGNGLSLSTSQEWVQVPHDPVETETGFEATPAAANVTPSWADDQPEAQPEVPTQADPNDGFHQVQRHRGRGDRDGGWRGRSGYRGGRGFRGDGRGRGRGGGGRGGGGPFRGPRRTDES